MYPPYLYHLPFFACHLVRNVTNRPFRFADSFLVFPTAELDSTMLADCNSSRQVNDLTKSPSTQHQSSTHHHTSLLSPEFFSPDLSAPNLAYPHPYCDTYSDFDRAESDPQYMTRSPSQNSSSRYQHSAFGGIATSESTPSPMLGESALPRTSWNQFDNSNSNHLSPQTAQRPSHNLHYRSHKRLSSGSSIASAGPDSPYTSTTAYPHIVDLDSTHLSSPPLESYDSEYSALVQSSKPLFLSSSSGLHESLLAPAFDNYNPSSYNEESLMAVQTAMREALMEERATDMTNHGLPARLPYGENYDGDSRSSTDGRSTVPKLDRTMSDIYQDELYNPSLAASVATQTRLSPNQANVQSPYSHIKGITDRLQEAKNEHLSARSSPATDVNRGRSPFRPTSSLASEGFSNADAPRLHSAAHMREQQKAKADAHAQLVHQPGRNEDVVSPRTISPKEAQLDYIGTEEDTKMPLFPQENMNKRRNRFSTNGSKTQQLARNNVDSNAEQSFGSIASSRRQSSSNYSVGAATPSAPNFTFMPPSIPGSVQTPQQYPFISQLRRQSSSLRSTSDQSPEFPTQLISMESSKSDSGHEQSSNSRQYMSDVDSSQMRSPTSPGLRRPSNTTADSGTYTCVSPGCALRFDTAAKLQKHRREAHRQSTPQRAAAASSTPTVASTTPTTSSNTTRNSQAGPHKCERINPSTGKPCNSIFSRSYDLTRHEDTIHNARKQKVRCHLCTEEKTFSRNDALTRHMRVVHPDVDFPGKTKRRGG